jgi:hypothetical protein
MTAAEAEVDALSPSSAAVASADARMIEAVGRRDRFVSGVAVDEAIDAALPAVSPAQPPAIQIEGATRSPGRVVILLSAMISAPDLAGAPSASPSAIDLELEPTAARRHRRLATYAEIVPATPATHNDRSVSWRRVAALYEIELVDDQPGGARIGAARVAGGAGAASPAERSIEMSDVAGAWDGARAELRLAVLAAELAQLPPNAPAARFASIRAELEPLLADDSLDEGTARRAEELAATAARGARPLTTALGRAASPPPNDG